MPRPRRRALQTPLKSTTNPSTLRHRRCMVRISTRMIGNQWNSGRTTSFNPRSIFEVGTARGLASEQCTSWKAESFELDWQLMHKLMSPPNDDELNNTHSII